MQSSGQTNYRRKEVTYFDGLNAQVSSNIAKKEELMHAENVRSPRIGTIEKREGMTLTGDTLIATTNYGVFFFNNDKMPTSVPPDQNTGLYRVSAIGGINKIYYLKSIGSVVFTGAGLNDATSKGIYTGSTAPATYTIIIDHTGTPDSFKWKKDSGIYTEDVVMTGSEQTLSDGVKILFTATTGHTATNQWVISVNTWTALAGDGIIVSSINDVLDSCVAEGDLYLVNKDIPSRYILGTDGTTVTTSTTAGAFNNLTRCPQASLINYYKSRLYVADYVDSSGRKWKNSVLRSSPPLGILALVNKDLPFDIPTWVTGTVYHVNDRVSVGADKYLCLKQHTSGVFPTDESAGYWAIGRMAIEVTDTKYILVGETLEIRRGTTTVANNLIVTAVNETSVTTYNPASNITILASDELWINGTYSTIKKYFRWVSNSNMGGVNAIDYDSFRLSSTTDNDAEEIKMLVNIGNVQMIGSNNNLGIWNDYTLRTLDTGVGCVSRRGYVKCAGSLFFIHYTGIYQTEGEMPVLISEKVAPYILNATKTGLSICVAGKKERSILFAIGDVTLKHPDGSTEKTLHDVCLEYNIIQKNWYVHTNVKATSMTTYFTPSFNYDRLMMTTTNVNYPVVEFLASNIYLDIASEIHMRADTPNLMIGQLFEKMSYPLEIVIEMERGAGLKCFVSLDMGAWYPLEGEASKGLTILKVARKELNETMPPRCRNLRVSLRHDGKQLCKISKVAINYAVSAEEEVQLSDETQPTPYLIS